MILNRRREYNWHVARLDYWWWFANPDLEELEPEKYVFLWETENGEITAILNPEAPGQAFLQIHPEFDTPNLMEEMVATAEARLMTPTKEKRQRLWVWIDSQDQAHREVLMRRGFQRVNQMGQQEVQHRRSLDEPLPQSTPTPGYTIRALGDGLELLERCYASGLGFHNDDIHHARDNRDQR